MNKRTSGQRQTKRRTAEQNRVGTKTTARQAISHENDCITFSFANIDRDGQFAFDPSKIDACELLETLIELSTMKWSELNKSKGKTRHHPLEVSSLSAAAKERIKYRRLEEDVDALFSFRINGRKRLIGLRYGATFHVIWYDAKHGFSISKDRK